MKTVLLILIALSTQSYASSLYSTELFKTWPEFSLKHEFADEDKDMIEFEETDFISLKEQAAQENAPLIPSTKSRVFGETLNLKDKNIRYTVFMGATAGNRVSGFYQGIGASTMLIENELYMDASVTHMQYNFENRYYDRHFNGDKYRVETMLHWYPSDNFSLHLGLGHTFDK